MPDVGRLRWVMTADTRQFDSAIRRTGRNLRRFASLAAGAFTVGRASQFLRSTVEQVDNLAKVADAAGVTAEQLQVLRHAADLAGVSQARFDDNLLRFTRRLGMARMGFGPLFENMRRYDQLALAAVIATESTTEAFARMSAIIARAPSRPVQTALTTMAFGTGGARMVNLMRGGPQGLAAAQRSAEQNLALISTDTARAMEALQDSATRAYGNMESTVLNTSTQMLQQVTGLIDRLDRFVLDLRRGGILGNLGNLVFPNRFRRETTSEQFEDVPRAPFSPLLGLFRPSRLGE